MSKYESMSVAELRSLCKTRELGTGVWRAGASKKDLLRALDTGRVPQGGTLSGLLAGTIEEHLDKIKIPEEYLKQAVDEYLADKIPTELKIVPYEGKEIKLESQHRMFPFMLDLLMLQKHLWLVGPAGSGKSTAVSAAARAMCRDFIGFSVGPDTRKSDLYGYMNAVGQYVDSLLKKGVTSGAVVCIDEYDAGNASVGTCMNQVLDRSEFVSFGNAMMKKDPNFRVVATANTYGLGANRVYVGRNQIDGATLDRFAYLEWPYDEGMEKNLSPDDGWTTRVQKYRQLSDRLGIRAVISPRASIEGGDLYKAWKANQTNAEWSIDGIEDSFIFKGIATHDKEKLRTEYNRVTAEVERSDRD